MSETKKQGDGISIDKPQWVSIVGNSFETETHVGATAANTFPALLKVLRRSAQNTGWAAARVPHASDRSEIGEAIGLEDDAAAAVLDYVATLTASLSRAEPVLTPRPLNEWHEDHGPVLWWQYEVCQPPYAGSPLDTNWPFSDEDEEDGTLWWTPAEPIAKAVMTHVARATPPESGRPNE